MAFVKYSLLAAVVLTFFAAALISCSPPSSKHKELPIAKPGVAGSFGAGAADIDPIKALSFCLSITQADDLGKLSGFSDSQIANGVCEASALSVVAISKNFDDETKIACGRATVSIAREFKSRFPGHDLKEAVGRC